MKTMPSFELIFANIILIPQKIFVLKLFKIIAHQRECSRLEQRSGGKFLMDMKTMWNFVKNVRVYIEACFRHTQKTKKKQKKNTYKRFSMGLPLRAFAEKTDPVVEMYWWS